MTSHDDRPASSPVAQRAVVAVHPGREPVETYDAVVVGASFAGLAAASQLAGAGRVLLVDRERIGAGQTSACGTLLAVLERLVPLAVPRLGRVVPLATPDLLRGRLR